ncbi:uncharacterized protein TNCV_903991 [Trichonephila clavipes]|nr:uncharacterized protein TNCV_903991 [Trichonephila clavipes]
MVVSKIRFRFSSPFRTTPDTHFSALRLLGKAPAMVGVVDNHPELSGKVMVIFQTGYQGIRAKNSGLSLQCRSSRTLQKALTDFISGHLRGITFVQGGKSFFTSPCSLPASPAHLLDCWGISLRQLFEDQELVCNIITRIIFTAVATNGNRLYDPASQGTRTCPSPVEISPSISRKVESGTRASADD